MLKRFVILGISLVALSATLQTMAATVFSQASDVVEGRASDLDFPNGLLAADDFILGAQANVTSISWFGGYAFGSFTPPATDNFTIAFYNDAGGIPALAPFMTFNVGNAVNRVDTGVDYNLSIDHYSYAADININLLAGTQYYLSVFTDTTGAPSRWFWGSSGALNNWLCEPVVSADCGTSWILNLNDENFSHAFSLNTSVPLPPAFALLGFGLAGLSLSRRQTR